MTEAYFLIDIFVRQVHPARKGRVTVYHQYLSVIPVILVCGQKRHHRRKYLALYAQRFHPPVIVLRKQGQRTCAVVHKPDFDTFSGLSDQDVQDSVPHMPPFHDKILQEYEIPGPLQLIDHLLEFILSQRKILDAGVAIGRIFSFIVDISEKTCLRL